MNFITEYDTGTTILFFSNKVRWYFNINFIILNFKLEIVF